MVLVVAANHRLQPTSLCQQWTRACVLSTSAEVFQLGCHPPIVCRSTIKYPVLLVLPTDVSEPQKIEGFRLPFPSLLRRSAANAKLTRKRTPKTFNFLGFTHICGKEPQDGVLYGATADDRRMTAKLKDLRRS